MIQRGTSIPYFKSFNRPMLVLGVDRSLFFLLVALCMPIAVSGHFSPLMDLTAALVFTSGYLIGLLLTRTDPQLLILYKRSIRYSEYYCAQPCVHAKEIALGVSVPVVNGSKGLL